MYLAAGLCTHLAYTSAASLVSTVSLVWPSLDHGGRYWTTQGPLRGLRRSSQGANSLLRGELLWGFVFPGQEASGAAMRVIDQVGVTR